MSRHLISAQCNKCTRSDRYMSTTSHPPSAQALKLSSPLFFLQIKMTEIHINEIRKYVCISQKLLYYSSCSQTTGTYFSNKCSDLLADLHVARRTQSLHSQQEQMEIPKFKHTYCTVPILLFLSNSKHSTYMYMYMHTFCNSITYWTLQACQ